MVSSKALFSFVITSFRICISKFKNLVITDLSCYNDKTFLSHILLTCIKLLKKNSISHQYFDLYLGAILFWFFFVLKFCAVYSELIYSWRSNTLRYLVHIEELCCYSTIGSILFVTTIL